MTDICHICGREHVTEEERLQARVRALEAALREWRDAESSSDCIACCTLDAALAAHVSTETPTL